MPGLGSGAISSMERGPCEAATAGEDDVAAEAATGDAVGTGAASGDAGGMGMSGDEDNDAVRAVVLGFTQAGGVVAGGGGRRGFRACCAFCSCSCFFAAMRGLRRSLMREAASSSWCTWLGGGEAGGAPVSALTGEAARCCCCCCCCCCCSSRSRTDAGLALIRWRFILAKRGERRGSTTAVATGEDGTAGGDAVDVESKLALSSVAAAALASAGDGSARPLPVLSGLVFAKSR